MKDQGHLKQEWPSMKDDQPSIDGQEAAQKVIQQANFDISKFQLDSDTCGNNKRK